MILTINGKQAALMKGSSIEYVSENRIFTDADDYSMEIELPLSDCPQNLDIFATPSTLPSGRTRNSSDWTFNTQVINWILEAGTVFIFLTAILHRLKKSHYLCPCLSFETDNTF